MEACSIKMCPALLKLVLREVELSLLGQGGPHGERRRGSDGDWIYSGTCDTGKAGSTGKLFREPAVPTYLLIQQILGTHPQALSNAHLTWFSLLMLHTVPPKPSPANSTAVTYNWFPKDRITGSWESGHGIMGDAWICCNSCISVKKNIF